MIVRGKRLQMNPDLSEPLGSDRISQTPRGSDIVARIRKGEIDVHSTRRSITPSELGSWIFNQSAKRPVAEADVIAFLQTPREKRKSRVRDAADKITELYDKLGSTDEALQMKIRENSELRQKNSELRQKIARLQEEQLALRA